MMETVPAAIMNLTDKVAAEMRRRRLWRKLLTPAPRSHVGGYFTGLLLAAVVSFAGCKRASTDSAPAQRPPTALQIELDRVSVLPFEPDPERRPLIISEPASNRVAWTISALNRGFAESGHTNAWDPQVKTLFEAYADLTTGNPAAWPALTKALSAVALFCDDPMVQYMRRRYRAVNPGDNALAVAIEYLRAHE